MKRFAVFLIVGGSNTALGLVIMLLLNMATHNPYLSNVAAYVIGFFTSYLAHDSITFRNIKGKRARRIIPYLLVYLVSFLTNYLVLNLLLRVTPWPVEVIFVMASAVFAVTSYVLNRSFVFSGRIPSQEQ